MAEREVQVYGQGGTFCIKPYEHHPPFQLYPLDGGSQDGFDGANRVIL